MNVKRRFAWVLYEVLGGMGFREGVSGFGGLQTAGSIGQTLHHPKP